MLPVHQVHLQKSKGQWLELQLKSKVTPFDYSIIISHPGIQWRSFTRPLIPQNSVAHWKIEYLALRLHPPSNSSLFQLLTRSLLDLPSACLGRTTTATIRCQRLDPVFDLIKGYSYQSCIFSSHPIKAELAEEIRF